MPPTDPMRASGGIALFLGKRGFISGDVEVVTYSTAKFEPKDQTVNTFGFDSDNQKIKSIYKTGLNFRGGTEFRFNSLMVRGGFAYLSDPTNGFDGKKRNAMQISAGFGFRGSNQYIDFALVNSRTRS